MGPETTSTIPEEIERLLLDDLLAPGMAGTDLELLDNSILVSALITDYLNYLTQMKKTMIVHLDDRGGSTPFAMRGKRMYH